MPAIFREVFPYAGVDELTATGNVAIIVPLKGSNVVLLEGGSNLKVASTLRPAVQVDEITDPHYFTALANQLHPIDSIEMVYTIAQLKLGIYRIFKITGNSLAGFDVAKVQAINPRTSRVEATLKVLVLGKKLIKISIRPAQIRGDQEKLVSFTNASLNVQSLVDQMNAIWQPQANIVFQLAKSDPALIDGLTPKSEGADIKNPTLLASFQNQKDTSADFTAFLVRRAYDGNDVVNGVTNAKAGVVLISDSRSESTLAHEAGHFLGALGEDGKYIKDYGHQGTDPKLLMRDGGAGWKIPFGLVPDFNKNYRKH